MKIQTAFMKMNIRKSWKGILTWSFRILIGGLFIFSGFTKAVDPWGTLYKVNDYLTVMSLNLWPNLTLVGVFFLCGIEFVTGVFLLLGCFRKSIPIVAGLIMLFMLPLTLWIALSDPVADCGCFGDALIISNWATFWKNILISAGVIWLIKYNRLQHWIITPALQWICFVASGFFIVIISLIGYLYQPLVDFRQYQVGERIYDVETSVSELPSYEFVYEKNGERKVFQENDELPSEDDGWIFIERIELPRNNVADSYKHEKNFRIWDKNGEEDETEEAILSEGKELIVMMPQLSLVSPATTWKLNSLYEWSLKNNVNMIGVVAGTKEEIAEWEDLSMASYAVYTADDTQIKEIVRGNPGIVYLEDGIIEWKSTLAAINIDDFLSPDTSTDAKSFGFENYAILRNIMGIYLIILSVLIVLSFMPKLRNLYFRRSSEKNEVGKD
ncbi:MAG: DoxX family protein [Muribaculaceae bacterium]|nr:DoxX family protein [Muribaculaceae bacterium]